MSCAPYYDDGNMLPSCFPMAEKIVSSSIYMEDCNPTSGQTNDYKDLETVKKFAANMLTGMKPLEKDFQKVLNEHFWDIL